MTRQRMSAQDTAWLHMDRPLNRMIVNNVMWFDEPLDWDAVRSLVQERMVDRFPHFRQRVVQLPAMVWWEDVPDFDVGAHLHRAALPAPGGMRELQDFVSGVAQNSLPVHRPLWEFYLVDGFHGRGSAIVSRIHHCIADGIALARVLMSLTDDPEVAAHAGIADDTGQRGRIAELTQLGATVMHEAGHPLRVMHEGASAAEALAKLLALPPDARTSLRGKPDVHKKALWSDPIALAAVRDAAHARHATVNDVLLSAIAGALRDHLARHDGSARDVRAILPVNLRPLDEPLPARLGNRFGLAYLTLPVSVDDPDERLAETRRRTGAVKNSAEGVVSYEVLDLIGRVPYALEQAVVGLFAGKGSLVVTNVPGPQRPVFLAGRKVRGTVGWPPESGNVGIGVSLISYDGEIILGLLADEHIVPDSEIMMRRIVSEFERLIGDRPRGTEVPTPEDVRPSTA